MSQAPKEGSAAKRLMDWGATSVQVDPPKPEAMPRLVGDAVVYSEDYVVAYFDDMGKNVNPAHATWAKLWTPEGLKIVQLEKES